MRRHKNILFYLLPAVCFFLSASTFAAAQSSEIYLKFAIEFTDKNNPSFSFDKPLAYLSPRAVQRRKNFAIPLTASDFPVNSQYLTGLRPFIEEICVTSKWLNTVLVIAAADNREAMEKLPFVKSVKYVGKSGRPRLLLRRGGKNADEKPPDEKTENPYGFSEFQNRSLNLPPLHAQNYRGEGMLIAVLDGGFTNGDIMPFFDKARHENRILPGYDFVENDDYVYETTAHGSQVLSVMAADIPHVMVGSAPDAAYVCLKTEDNSGEYPAEEMNWVAALEYADSIGADIVNSSLGYTEFSDESLSYNYRHLDGKTSLATRATAFAFQKGMIVVNSVGNEGDTPWKYLDVPADGENVLAVGATDPAGYKTKFSSFGPTADGRIKPDVCALGKEIAVASVYSIKVNATKGTSFSAPLIAGAIACLWQAVPYRSNAEILDAVLRSGDRADRPDNETGYGTPDFAKALEMLR